MPTRDEVAPKMVNLDERVKYHTFTRFKSKVRAMQRNEIEAFKHFDDIWQIEQEAVLVPFDMWIRIQQELGMCNEPG